MLIIFFLLFISSRAAATQRLFYLDVNTVGRGGANYGLSKGMSAFFYNPAGFASEQLDGGLLIWDHTLALEGNTYSAIRQFLTLPPSTDTAPIYTSQSFFDIVNKLQTADIEFVNSGPVGIIGYMRRYFGFLLYTEEYLNVNIDEGNVLFMPIPDPDDSINFLSGANAIAELSGAAKYRMLDFGVNVKYYEKAYAKGNIPLMTLLSMDNSVIDTFTKEISKVYRENYFSVDVGMRYRITDYFILGLAANDVYTFYKRGAIYNINTAGGMGVSKSSFLYTAPPMRLSMGLSYLMDLPYYINIPRLGLIYSRHTLFTFDIQDFLNKEDFFKKINFGIETELRDFLKLRGGFYQGYPVFGFGLNFFHYYFLDYAFYTEERGQYTGWKPHYMHIIRFMIKI